MGKNLFKNLIFTIPIFIYSTLLSAQPFGSDEVFKSKNSFYIDACKRSVNIPIGGSGNSKFETMSCEQLIQDFAKQERDGRSKARIDKFMKEQGLQYLTFDQCMDQFVRPGIIDRNLNKAKHTGKKQNNWETCAKGVQSILDYIKDQKDFFIKSLQYRIETYDALYIADRSIMIPSGAADNKDCSQQPSIRDFYRTGRFSGMNDCEWIARGAPRCVLKLSENTSKNINGDVHSAKWSDRQKCNEYIKNNTAAFEAFGTGLAKLYADMNAGSAPVKNDEVKIDCTNYDPNKKYHTALESGVSASRTVDTMIICAYKAGESAASGQDAASSSSGVGNGR